MWKTSAVLLCALVLAACRPENVAPAAGEIDASGMAVSASLSTNQIRVGDPLEAVVTVTHPEHSTVEFPSLARGKEVLVRDTVLTDGEPENGLLQTTARFQLTSLTVTNHILGEGTVIRISGPDGVRSNAFPFLSFEVLSSLAPGETDPRPIDTALARWPAPPSRWGWLVLGLLVLLVAGFLAVRKILATPSLLARPVPPPVPPHVTALEALDALRHGDGIEAPDAAPFYVGLSAIVRGYLEARFHLRAPERTTEEFIHDAARARALSSAHRSLLATFLEQSDLVKFARALPRPEVRLRALDSAEAFVRDTAEATADETTANAASPAEATAAKGAP